MKVQTLAGPGAARVLTDLEPRWEEDRRWLLRWEHLGVEEQEGRTQHPVQLLAEHTHPVTGVAFAPDSTKLAMCELRWHS